MLADSVHTALLYSGLALFSICDVHPNGRAMILPLLGLWACIVVFRSEAKQKIILCVGALVAMGAGPILQVLLVLALGGDPGEIGRQLRYHAVRPFNR